MSDFFIGIPIDMTIGMIIGIAIGLNLGIIIGNKQKPWSELTEEEKRHQKIIIGAGSIILLIGLILNLWFFFNW